MLYGYGHLPLAEKNKTKKLYLTENICYGKKLENVYIWSPLS